MEIVNINYQECPMHPMHPMLYALSVVNKAIAKLIATTTRQKAKRLKEDANEHFPIRFTYYPLVKLKKWFSRPSHLLASPQKKPRPPLPKTDPSEEKVTSDRFLGGSQIKCMLRRPQRIVHEKLAPPWERMSMNEGSVRFT